jgi:restriction system protein
MIEKQISNSYLNESKIIKAKTNEELKLKEMKQNQQWKQKEEILRMKDSAKIDTDATIYIINQYRSLLKTSLGISNQIEWDLFYDYRECDFEEPELKNFIENSNIPKEDKFIEFFFSSIKRRREQKLKEAEKLYQEAYTEYLYEKNRFYNERNEKNNQVDTFRKSFENGEKEAVEQYFNLILNNSPYPEGFIKVFKIGFEQETRNLIIEYRMPHPENLPKIVEYKYIQSRNEINARNMKPSEFQEFYDDVLYQITLKTTYECFISDYPNHLDSIVFNGFVNGIDSSTGNEFNSRIISILVKKEEYMSLNLERVVARDCFRKLNGQSSGSLYHLSPIRPILELNTEDERFIETRDIIAEINSVPNLAEMKWDDFEHLISNVFSLYFKEIGEVKITRKSREGGIDGVIFDNDPIRGGKYLVQAKRYNSIVPPSAVRDLNGAKDHEKATRGILITTGYFGPDSKSFAKVNNITLIDGRNLVSMLNEYGYNVRCDIKKGKKYS